MSEFLDVGAVLAKVAEGAGGDGFELMRRVGRALDEVDDLTAELGRIRREAAEREIEAGTSQNEVGRRIGLSSARMSQVLRAGPLPERAFFGVKGGQVVAGVAEKREANKANPGPVVALDDLHAYDMLRSLLQDLGLRVAYEVVQPPGNVLLNRDGLVLICGPRHSPLVAQVLQADDHLGFERDEGGWYLVDRVTGTVYRSPEDSGQPGDVAYFGRLPRPDGKGHFLYLAGIHAAGAAGVVHYMRHELGSLYRAVRSRRFSMLISCRYDWATHQVVSSQRVTPIYHPGK